MAILVHMPAALAGHITLSDAFDGSESLLQAQPGTCPEADMLRYRQFSALQVSVGGDYSLTDPTDGLPGDIVVAVYDGSFDPGDPAANRIASIDEGQSVSLAAGRDYIVVVQSYCSNASGVAFAVAISGPGEITGADVVNSPAHTLGLLGGDDPMADFSGTMLQYDLHGPVQVPHNGRYWYADASYLDGRFDMRLLVYEGPFNPADTSENFYAIADDSGEFILESGKDYYFVVVPYSQGASGEWHWVLFPPGPLQFNAGMMGAWVNLDTLGQGILIDVFTASRLVFLAWFTFDLEADDGSVTPMIGGAGQRWLTAFGTYQPGDSSVSMSIENTTGGAFDSSLPEPEPNTSYGTGTLEFSDCLNGSFTYDIPAGPVLGVVPLNRVQNDHFSLCSILGTDGPGVITG